MINIIKQTILTRDFIFVLILIGFIMLVSFLLLEGRRDNIRLKQLNQKVKDLIAGDYSQVLDMQGNSEITNITNNLNDLSEVIRLTQENLEQESKRLHSICQHDETLIVLHKSIKLWGCCIVTNTKTLDINISKCFGFSHFKNMLLRRINFT